ncbi:MAG TPA: hypothetical protein VMI94_19995 [Bryobacteraceae bacterium]|nr:hypothetical protein [Bryobacteraceae bacterium]
MLEGVERVLVIDWPSPEVPELLARSGLQVVVRGGPDRVDLVYTFRPLDDRLDSIRFGRGWRGEPRGCWLPDSEVQRARELVETAGLKFVSEPYIGDVVR